MGFYTHLSVYAAVILFLAILRFATSSGTNWFHLPMLGWGIAVVIYAAVVFIIPGRLAGTEHMIEKELGQARKLS